MGEQIPVIPSVLKWARERSGFTLEEMREKYKKIDDWENGKTYPTYSQLEALSGKYKCPAAVFFFPEPPKEEPIKKSFRTLPDSEFYRIPRQIHMLLRKAKAMQLNLEELNDGINPSTKQILKNIKFNINSSISSITGRIRKYLGITLEQQCSWKNTAEAFEHWREILIECGVSVFKDHFDDNDFSGFCLYDTEFPVIFANNSNVKSRQVFTLFHELAHLLCKTSGIDKKDNDYINNIESNGKGIETFCNEFSAVFLVPNNDFNESIAGMEFDEEKIIELANKYKVSREVILRKLLDRDLVNQDYYKEKSEEWTKQTKQKGNSGNYYNTQITYLGRDYINLALSKYHQNKITIEQLSDYLNVKTKNIIKFEDIFMGRGA